MNISEDKTKPVVVPQTLRGFRDLMPQEVSARNDVVETIRSVYEKYGFVPLEAPILEYQTTLAGVSGDEAKMFRVPNPDGGPMLGMRFDLTVQFAKLLAQYPEALKPPFRRYQIGPVFRADEPQVGKGKYRQFTQFDIDAAGSYSVALDAEIVATMVDVMYALGLSRGDFKVRFNNRKLMDALLIGYGIDDKSVQKNVLRVIDKLEKHGPDEVRKELGDGRTDKESGNSIKGVLLPSSLIDKILEFSSVVANSREATLNALAPLLPASTVRDATLQEMVEFHKALSEFRVDETDAFFDPSLTRGLQYYSGPVFEAFLPAAPQIGSIMGGGRFDDLTGRFMDQSIPATGASIGLDRIMDGLEQLGKIEKKPTTTKVFILTFRDVPSAEVFGIACDLRAEDISTEIFFGDQKTSFKDQLAIANAKQIPIAVIMGGDELKSNNVSVKDLRTGMQARAGIQDREEYRKAGKTGQVTVPRSDLIKTVKQMLVSPLVP